MVIRTIGTPAVQIPTGGITRPTSSVPLPDINPDIRLGRGGATAANLIINRTFDGITPQAAFDRIRSQFQGTIAKSNATFVDATINARVRDMQVALNNVYTKGTPNRNFLDAQQPATVKVMASMTDSAGIVYEVTKPGQQSKYFSKSWSGQFVETTKPNFVIMSGQIGLDPPKLKMDYPAWKHAALSGPTATITEG